MTPMMCPKCRQRRVDYFRSVDLAECQDCFHRFHLRTSVPNTMVRPVAGRVFGPDRHVARPAGGNVQEAIPDRPRPVIAQLADALSRVR